MNEIFINTIGDRITYCRSSLCLTRKELSESWQAASVPTISRWELDTVEIPIKKMLSLVQFFNNNGLVVTEKWLKDGEGVPPFLLRNDKFDEPDFDSLAQEKLLDINRQTQNFIFGQVKNNSFSPFIKYGDYIGGVDFLINIENIYNSLIGEIIFLKKSTGLLVGILQECNEKIIISNLKKELDSTQVESVEAIGKVQWIIRRP